MATNQENYRSFIVSTEIGSLRCLSGRGSCPDLYEELLLEMLIRKFFTGAQDTFDLEILKMSGDS